MQMNTSYKSRFLDTNFRSLAPTCSSRVVTGLDLIAEKVAWLRSSRSLYEVARKMKLVHTTYTQRHEVVRME